MLRSSLKRSAPPLALGALFLRSRRPRSRFALAAILVGFWSAIYAKYRKEGREQTAREWELLRTANWETFTRHYNEEVPTIEEEFDIWGEYHQHRHEMRYDLVAAEVRQHLPIGGRVLDIGAGSALVADRLIDIDATYVGVDFGGHHVTYAAKKYADREDPLSAVFGRAAGENLPFADATFDVVVLSEVIEHLMRPELAVWEVARVLRPGGVFVMTTNNASEAPLRSPLSHLFAWVEKALGATHPKLISLRPVVWPVPMTAAILPDGVPEVWLPHTHHIYAETRDMFAGAGMDTLRWSTFEFPPPHGQLSRFFEARGDAGKRVVDGIEWMAVRTPGVRRLGCHLFMTARKTGPPIAPAPPAGIWPGPFSGAVR